MSVDKRRLWPVALFGVALMVSWFLSERVVGFIASEVYPEGAELNAFSPLELVYVRLRLSVFTAGGLTLASYGLYTRSFGILLPVSAALGLGGVLGWFLAVPLALALLVPGDIGQIYSVHKAVGFAVNLCILSGAVVALPVGVHRLKEAGYLPSRERVAERRKTGYAVYGLACLFASSDPVVAVVLFAVPAAVAELSLAALSRTGADSRVQGEKEGAERGDSLGSAHYDSTPLLVLVLGGIVVGACVVGFFVAFSAQVDSWLRALAPAGGDVLYAVKAPTDFVYARALLAGTALLAALAPFLAKLAKTLKPEDSRVRRFASPAGLSFTAGAGAGVVLAVALIGPLAGYTLGTVDMLILSPRDMARYLALCAVSTGAISSLLACFARMRMGSP